MRISDWSSDVCSSDLRAIAETWNDPFEAANAVGTALAAGRSLHDIMAWGDTVAAVTPGPVRDAAQHIFTSGINVTGVLRSEEHTSELQSLMRISYAVFCLQKTNNSKTTIEYNKFQHINSY